MSFTAFHTKLRARDAETILILIAVLSIIAGLGVFMFLMTVAGSGEPHAFDKDILLALRHPDDLATPIGPHQLLGVMRDITALGSTTVLALFALLAACYSALTRRMGVTLLIIGSTVGAVALASFLKTLVNRARPDVVPHLIDVHTLSFPSGHAMLSAAIYLSLGTILAQTTQEHHRRIFILGAALGLVGLIGLSRIYLGVHYPSDVLAGWAAGIAWAMGCWLVGVWLRMRKPQA